MTELELYKYITENNIEWHWGENNEQPDVIILPYTFQIEDLNNLLDPTIFDDEGVPCVMKNGYLAIWMRDICEYYDIELERVFKVE